MNLDHAHLHHPKLGQVPTNGNRFKAILEASKRLHGIQAAERFTASMLRRVSLASYYVG